METLSSWWSQLRPRGESAEEVAAEEERKRAVIEKLARAIVARRLEAPAALFLELNRPLGFIYSQATYFAPAVPRASSSPRGRAGGGRGAGRSEGDGRAAVTRSAT